MFSNACIKLNNFLMLNDRIIVGAVFKFSYQKINKRVTLNMCINNILINQPIIIHFLRRISL